MQKWWRLGATLYTLVIFGTLIITGVILIALSRSVESAWDEGLLLNLGTEAIGGAFLFWLLSLGWEGYKNLAQKHIQKQETNGLLVEIEKLTHEVAQLNAKISLLETDSLNLDDSD